MKKFLIISGVFTIAFMILLVSIFSSSEIKYSVTQKPPQPSERVDTTKVDYILPYAGRVLPDSPLWSLKALRDKVWFGVTTSHIRRAQLALLFADKRLVMSEILFEKGESEIAISTFTKGEKYLPIAVEEEKIARSKGVDTDIFLTQLATAALKHREVAESLIQLAPEDARPMIIGNEKYAIDTYGEARNALYSRGLPVPKDPFNGD